jgi:hypothetical protein
MGLIKLQSDASGFSSVFQGWMTNMPEGDLKTTSIRMEDDGDIHPAIAGDTMVRLVIGSRRALETHLDAFREGIQIVLPLSRNLDIFFEVPCGGRFTMSIEWAHAFELKVGDGEPAQAA